MTDLAERVVARCLPIFLYVINNRSIPIYMLVLVATGLVVGILRLSTV